MNAGDGLDGLPDVVARQRRLLRAVGQWCEQEGDARWLAVGCSLARGNADALSDLDIARAALELGGLLGRLEDQLGLPRTSAAS